MPPLEIERPVAHAAERIRQTHHLRDVPPIDLPRETAYLYDYLNFAHPFREGNGRSQREFFVQLLNESGHTLDWERVHMSQLHIARNEGNLSALSQIFDTIIG